MYRVQTIVAAGGAGRRFGSTEPKQILSLAGRSVLEWSVLRFLDVSHQVIIALPADLVASVSEQFSAIDKVSCVSGGASRWQSVRAAWAQTSGRATDLIAVHDAARPAVTAEDLKRVIEAAAGSGAAILGRPVSDTLKRTRSGLVEATVDRSDLFRAETPQVFARGVFARAVELADRDGLEPTDEASLVEVLGDTPVKAVEARSPNPKLTEPGDVLVIERLLAGGVEEGAPS